MTKKKNVPFSPAIMGSLIAPKGLPDMLEDLQGQIERVTFHNDETGFTIARLKVKGFRELITAVGNLMAPVPGQVTGYERVCEPF